MLTSDFSYDLPGELIAKYPTVERTASRLLCLQGDSGAITHSFFLDICSQLRENDLLVMNDSKVIPARLFGYKETGGKVEIMLERITSTQEALVHIRASKSPKEKSKIIIGNNISLEVLTRVNDLYKVKFNNTPNIHTLLRQYGKVPLPPYLHREAQDLDLARYQTVYAKHLGSVAAPTAGLHFDEDLLQKIQHMGVELGYVTLHVGAGTFQAIRVDNIDAHKMHQELVTVSTEVCAKIQTTKAKGGRVIAVGTTTLRALETAALQGGLQAYFGDTAIFIKPGFSFNVVDALITNFHLPMTTLLILTCAFGGYEQILHAYQEAIQQKYRFYSYGDAMFIEKRKIPMRN